jgi:glycogen(starch) synthase
VRIGFHCWEFPPTIVGGLGTYAQSITPALAERGHEVQVWTPEHSGWPQSVPPLAHERVRVRRVPLFDATPAFPYVVEDELRHWGGFFSELLVFNLLAAAETRQALGLDGALPAGAGMAGGRAGPAGDAPAGLDVVAVQDWLSGMTGLILARERARPLVFHVHSTEWGRQPGGGSAAVHHFEGALGYAADAVITVSEAMREDLVAHGWDAEKVFAVWNGVDPQRYRPGVVPDDQACALRERYGIALDAPLLLFVGRLTSVKGIEALIEAMPAIVAAHPEARLIVLGVGDLQGQLAARVAALGLQEVVRLRYEFVSERERIAHYAACDLAVFPSTYEPFGIVSLEAMAMAKPVVVGARGVVGFREQVIASGAAQTGLHVDGGDPRDIAWGVNLALADRERMAAWGAAGRQRVLDHFTWAAAAAKTEAVYEWALSRFPGR